MKLENQVVSLELAKKMFELGFKQGGHYWWRIYIKSNEATFTTDDYCKSNPKDYTHYVAYTVAELGEMLPINCASWRSDKTLYSCQRFDFGGCCGQEITADTEADCRARLLIWLKENNYL